MNFLKHEIDRNGNIYYILNRSAKIYRADDKKINNMAHYKPRFFGYNEEDIKSYGSVVYEFKTNKKLKLLALDKNIKSFYDSAPKNIKQILDKQYGYDGTKAVIRDSNSKKDNELVDYLYENNFDGYATNLMDKVDGFDGLFHREIAICRSENYDTPTIKTQLSPSKIRRIQQEARLLEQNKKEKQTRKKRPSPRSSSLSPSSRSSSPSSSPNISKRLFGGKKKKRKSYKKYRLN